MLILYFSWDGLRGKRLGFWVYLEVKTVGTAVPASAAEETATLAAAKAVDKTAAIENISTQMSDLAVDSFDELIINPGFQVSYLMERWDSTVKDNVILPVGVEKIERKYATYNKNEAGENTTLGSYESSAKSDNFYMGAKYVVTFADGTTEEFDYEKIPVFMTNAAEIEGEMADAMNDLINDDPSLLNITVENDSEAALREASKARANEIFANAWKSYDESTQLLISEYYDLEMVEGTAANVWHLVVTGKYGAAIGDNDLGSKVGLSFNKNPNTGEATEILNNLKPDTVTVATESGKVNSTQITQKTDYETYFGTDGKKLIDAITNANSDIASASIVLGNNFGAITGVEGSQEWVGTVTITLKDNGGIATGTVHVPLNVVSNATISEIGYTDNRTTDDKEVEKGKESYSFEHIVLSLTYGSGKVEKLMGNANGFSTDKIVIDAGNWNPNKIGTQSVQVRVKGNNDKFISIPYAVFNTVKVEDKDLDWKGVKITSITSEDETIAKGSGNTLKVYEAGSTYLTITGTKDENTLSTRVKIDVKEDGTVSYSKDFSSSMADREFGENFAKYAEGQDVEVSVRDSEIANAVLKTDRLGKTHVQVTGNAEGSTELYVKFGVNKKLTYTAKVNVAEDGTVTISDTDDLNVSSISLPSATVTALESADYYSESVQIASDMDTAKAVIDEAVDEDTLMVNVTMNGVTDQVPLSTCEYVLFGSNGWGNLARYGKNLSKIRVRFDKKSADTATVSLKQKDDYVNADLGVAVASHSVIAGGSYIDVVEVTDDNGNTTYSIRPTALTDDWMSYKVSFKDKNGATAFVEGEVKGYQLRKMKVTPFKISADAEKDFTAPSKTEYTIGETFDASGASFSYAPYEGGQMMAVDVTADMFKSATNDKDLVFDSVDNDGDTIEVVFTYGDWTSSKFAIKVKPAEKKFSAAELGVPSGEEIEDVILKTTDSGIKVAESSKSFVYLTANKVNKSAAVTIKTTKGNTVDALVTVDENGQISVESQVLFRSHIVSVSEDDMNLTAFEVATSDDSVVYAEVQSGKVVITSLKPGTATVTASDKDGNEATIDVTVAEDGSITTTVHAFNADGWVDLGNGDWGYILNGERVVSKWVSVTEEDPYNNNEVGEVWYHFGADGKMQRGWISDPEAEWKIYLLDSNGRMMHSDWVNAPEQKELNRPAGIYHLTSDGAVQMNGWALAKGSDSIYWYCNAGNGLFEKDNPASWANEKLW